MAHDRLLEHYDTRYAGEATPDAARPEPVPLGLAHPADRFQAAAAFLPPRLRGGADILELGAGNGVVAESLRAGGVAFGTYTTAELSEVRLAGLRRTLGDDPRFRFVQADAEKLSERTAGCYDAIFMIHLIEHLIDPLRALADVRAQLRPGGFVYIDTPNIAKWTRRVKLALGRFPSTASWNEGLTTYYGEPADLYDEGHLHYFTYRSLELMLTERCGYSRVERLWSGSAPMPLGPKVTTGLARARPTLFSELVCIAHA